VNVESQEPSAAQAADMLVCDLEIIIYEDTLTLHTQYTRTQNYYLSDSFFYVLKWYTGILSNI